MITSSPVWWTTCEDLFNDGQPSDGYRAFIRDEYEAEAVDCFQNAIIPGLLQTEAYSRAISALQWPAAATQRQVDAWVAIRLKRQWGVFERPQRPRLHFIIDEAALYRQIGGPAILYEQLTHLLKLHDMQAITLQILPLREGSVLYPYPVMCFTIFSFTDRDKGPTLYTDHALYFSKQLEDEGSLFLCERVFMSLRTISAKSQQSKDYIQRALKVLDEAGGRLPQRKSK